MFRRNPKAKSPTIPTQKARLVRDLDTLSDAHLAVIIQLQVDKDGNVIAKRPVEFMWKRRIFHLTKVALSVGFDGSKKWILSLQDPETEVVDDIIREAPASSALDRARDVFLRRKMIERRRQRAS